jgi:hypothetical protein
MLRGCVKRAVMRPDIWSYGGAIRSICLRPSTTSEITKIKQPLLNTSWFTKSSLVDMFQKVLGSTVQKKSGALLAGSFVMTLDTAADYVLSPFAGTIAISTICIYRIICDPTTNFWHKACLLEISTAASWYQFFHYFETMPFIYGFFWPWVALGIPKFILFLELSRPDFNFSSEKTIRITLKRNIISD